jgi:hypothetical protein
MPVLMIVARDRESLYERLCGEFAGDSAVIVVLDRRFGERRSRSEPDSSEQPPDERRQRDRRQREIADQLQRLGWATVRSG